jgi:hypothetical protein
MKTVPSSLLTIVERMSMSVPGKGLDDFKSQLKLLLISRKLGSNGTQLSIEIPL